MSNTENERKNIFFAGLLKLTDYSTAPTFHEKFFSFDGFFGFFLWEYVKKLKIIFKKNINNQAFFEVKVSTIQPYPSKLSHFSAARLN